MAESGVKKIPPTEENLVLSFGGGLHTRASTDDINPREAAAGNNFLLDLENRDLKPRPPFDLIGTVPNAREIKGGGSLLTSSGTISTIFQAEDQVYEWNGLSTFTPVGTVNPSSKLRGHWRSHNWQLDDLLLLTDLNLLDTVKKWDGTTFSNVTFTNEAASGFGNFFARYLNITDERAVFANVKDGGGTSPHMVVGSGRSEYTIITVNDRPSSSLEEGDPFFLLTPDLKPINGHVSAFAHAIISSEKGSLFVLSGASAKDFSFTPFYPGSAAQGQESLAYIGNDIIYGRQGAIESVTDTNRFGDTEADDLSKEVNDQVNGYGGWTTVYNSRFDRAYLFPTGVSEVWVFQASLKGGEVSPWMRWKTNHALGFQPTFVMSMLDPVDGLEYTFMGDASGNIYRMEGHGDSGDGGNSNIATEFLTKTFKTPLDSQAYDVEGHIRYHKDAAVEVDLVFQYAGTELFDKSITVNLPAASGGNYYGGNVYYGGNYYYGQITGRLSRQKFFPPGQANEFQIKIGVTSNNRFAISGIELRFKASS